MRTTRENGNLRLSSSLFTVEVRARGGLTIQQMARSAQFTTFRSVPDIGFLQIGENGLSAGTVTVEQLVNDILSYADYLIQGVGFKTVIIGQLFRRQPWASSMNYNENVYHMNNLLAERVATLPKIHFWRHRGFWSSLDFLSRDGVHITDRRYMNRYLQSIKSAVLHYSRH